MKDIKKKQNKEDKPKYNMWQNVTYMIALGWSIYKGVIVGAIGIVIAMVGMSVTEMLVAPVILGRIEAGVNLKELFATIFIFSGMLILFKGLFNYLSQNALYGRVEVRTALVRANNNKRAVTFYANLLDTKFLEKNEQAVKCCRGNADSSEAIWTTMTELLANIIGFVIYMLLLSNLNIWIAIITIVITCLGYVWNKRFMEWGYRHREEEEEYSNKLYYIATSCMKREMAKDIRIFGMKEWMNDVWGSIYSLYANFVGREEFQYLLGDSIQIVLTILRNGIAYAVLVGMVLKGQLTASEFLLYFSAVSGFTAWVNGILADFATLNKQCIDISRIREFHDWPEPFLFEEGDEIPKTNEYELRLEHVTYYYPEAKEATICDMNLTIKPGEKLAVVGLNGAGKTTLTKLLCGFIDPTEGAVLLNGVDIRQYNRREYYRLFSAVFQEFSMIATTVSQNVSQTVEGEDEVRVREALEKAGLTEKMESLPKGIYTQLTREVYEDGIELSGGQTQRMMLARALYKDAPILVLDEPTAALDPIAESDLYQKYNEMTKGKSAIYISHRLASTRFCDRILYLEKGKILEEGTHEELLLKGGSYAGLYLVQSKYYQEGGEEYDQE